MTISLDPRSFLRIPFIYTSYKKLVGGYGARKLFVKNIVRAKPNQKILDIGCGPGDILDFLPEVNYFGFDLDENYIKKAKSKYQDKGKFTCSGITDFTLPDPGTFDIVIASGIVHHLNNQEAKKLFKTAKKALKPKGRFITLDGCFIKKQNLISYLLLKLDRGLFIRKKMNMKPLPMNHFKM
ncbi:methyltransferase family protein [Mariniflexile fucanivorans]|uniref:Methyltransferase family protein n=1 Tax=Mariniflexile fucanivorans TaxID=264023 RepID=A0A4R1RKV4_9FLAO|nr:class I SAM-dependent methyltransferase [Mariniflexile fucanivorans]TCL66659.1 methyltransferase family protein [Mariniflexile fucanivorans]